MSREFNHYYAGEKCASGIENNLKLLLKNEVFSPVILCIGSDIALGDSLAPLVGTLLCDKYKLDTFVYGTLKQTITAREVAYAGEFMKHFHGERKVVAIDAAIGNSQDIGLIKICNCGLFPGKGVGKELPKVGDISVMGIVASKGYLSYGMLNLTRLNLVYHMADKIAEGIFNALSHFNSVKGVG